MTSCNKIVCTVEDFVAIFCWTATGCANVAQRNVLCHTADNFSGVGSFEGADKNYFFQQRQHRLDAQKACENIAGWFPLFVAAYVKTICGRLAMFGSILLRETPWISFKTDEWSQREVPLLRKRKNTTAIARFWRSMLWSSLRPSM